MKSAGQIFILIVFGILLVVVGWLIEVRGFEFSVRQYQAQAFPQTEGKILSSQVITTRGSKGRIYYHPSFLYSYELNGQSYESRRYRYDGLPSGQNLVNQIVAAHPAGSLVAVYYNPNDPYDTILSPGVLAQDVAPLFMFAPVVLMLLFVFVETAKNIDWPGRTVPVAGGVKIVTDMMTTRVRLPRYQPSALAALAAGILSFVSGIIILVGFANSPVSASMIALLIIVVVSGLVYLWQYLRIVSGRQDLVIHEGSRLMELPLTYKRRERSPMPISNIRAVTLEKVTHRRRNGVTYTYAPTLQLRDNSSERLTDLSQRRAEALAAWLRQKLGVPDSVLSLGARDED